MKNNNRSPRIPLPNLFRRGLLASLAGLVLFVSGICHAMVELKDDQLSNVTGQALMQMNKIVGDDLGNGTQGMTFYTAGLDVMLDLNLNIEKLQLGCGGVNGVGCDLDIDHFSLGCITNVAGNCISLSPATGSNQKVGAVNEGPQSGMKDFSIQRPFFQFAIKNDGRKTLREVVGIRMGGENVSGPMSFGSLNVFSGYMNGRVKLDLQEQGKGRNPLDVAVTCGPSDGPCKGGGNHATGVNAWGYEAPERSLGLDNDRQCVLLVICEEFRNLKVKFDGVTRDVPAVVLGNREMQAMIKNLNLGRGTHNGQKGAVQAIVDSLQFADSEGIDERLLNFIKPIIAGSVADKINNQFALGLNTTTTKLDNNTYELPYNLSNIHQLDVSTPLFGLSFQKEDVAYPGYAGSVKTGWAMYAPDAFILNISDKTTVFADNIAGNTSGADGNIVGLEAAYRNCWGSARFC